MRQPLTALFGHSTNRSLSAHIFTLIYKREDKPYSMYELSELNGDNCLFCQKTFILRVEWICAWETYMVDNGNLTHISLMFFEKCWYSEPIHQQHHYHWHI